MSGSTRTGVSTPPRVTHIVRLVRRDLLPGLALSGNTHSFDGLANTLPAEDDVSFPGTEPNAVVIVGVDKEELDGRGGGLAGGEDFAGGLVVRALDEEGVMLDMAVLGDGAGLGLG